MASTSAGTTTGVTASASTLSGKDALKKKVYLFTYPPMPYVSSASPFAIKVESFLRLNGIPYETVYTLFAGSKGTMPYARLHSRTDGEEVPDTNLMIPRFKSEFGVDCDAGLTPEQRAAGHAVLRMVEEHTAQMGFYYRYGLHCDEFYDALDIPRRLFRADSSLLGWLASKVVPSISSSYSRKKMKYRGLAQHTDEEKWSFCNDDLRAVADYLGDEKDWFFGGDGATTVDCVLFGHLSQFLYIPLDFPQARFLRDECPNVVRYVDRFRDRYWPDFDERCEAVAADFSVRPEPARRGPSSGMGAKAVCLSAAVVVGAIAALACRRK